MSGQPVRIDDGRPQDTFSVHSGGAASVHRKNRKWLYMGIAVLLALIAGWILGAGKKVKEGVAFIAGAEEYVYAYPLVLMDVTRQVTTAAANAGEYSSPINQFARIRTYVSPDFKNVVRISVNSLWSFGFVDLDQEPMIVSLPDMGDRYIVMQVVNMWTDDIGEVGTRTNGGKAGNYLIASSKWKGEAPKEITQVFKCTTRYAWVLVQMAAASPADFDAVHVKQDQLKMTPLSAWGTNYTPPTNVPVDPNVDLTATPFDQVNLMTGATFFNRLAKLLVENPPYATDTRMIEGLKKLGVEAGKSFDATKIDPAILAGINKSPAYVNMQFETGPYAIKTVNGWLNILDLGAYGTDYQTRAFIANVGLGALQKEDAVYPSAFVDSNGIALDGTHKYVMHFEKGGLPPSKVNVWSISPYRGNFYVRNALNRYGILSSMPLKFNADGSLDVYLQKDSPGVDKDSNWLPIPGSGSYNVTVRVYQPEQSMLDGTYKLPPITKVE
ncbi:MAG TPA: DUF1254 domain-containing protein [Terriglobales bacterium]|nr:DUF1254 domain-containing protein [Terriglobales bacterium]